MVCLALGAAVVSFVIRDLEIGALNSMDRYWMWFVALEHITANLSATALVETPGTSIDVEVPNSLKQLWLDQQEALEIEGIFPFHFHSMWLRLTMAWGWIPAVLILLVMLNVLLFRGHRPSQARSLAGVCLVLGLTMGLFYLSNVSIPVLLAMFRLFIQQPRVK
jgi:hypothetical protein